jgi:hypothetical protein
MNEDRLVQVLFGPEDIQLYNLAEKRCIEKNTNMSDYIKELIKVDLAWGRFARRKKDS